MKIQDTKNVEKRNLCQKKHLSHLGAELKIVSKYKSENSLRFFALIRVLGIFL